VRSITATVGGGGAYSASTAGLADGTWTAQAVQGDAAGNTGTSVSRTFTLDASAPALALTSPGAGLFTHDPTQVFAGNAGTAAGDAAAVSLELFAGPSAAGAPLRSLTAPLAAGAFSLTAAPLDDGTYTLLARQSDDLGHVGASAPRTFTVDTVAPSVTITAPAADAVLAQGDAASAAFACADERSGLESCASSIAPGAALDTAALGAHTITISARDRAGNTRVERRTYTVVARVTGPSPPVVGAAAIAQSPADAGLAIGVARARRAGRTVIVTVTGTVVPAATGRVTVTAKDITGTGRRMGATIHQGRWHVTLHIRLSGRKRPTRVRLTIAYSGDRSHRAKSVDRRVPITHA
jgi:hypothetical protein